MITRDQRLERLNSEITEAIAELYSSFELADAIDEVVKKYQIIKLLELVHTIGDTILGFYHTKDLPTLLQKEVGVSADAAQRIVADLAEFLTSVLEREKLAANPKLGELKDLHQQFTKPATALKPITSEPITLGRAIAVPHASIASEEDEEAVMHNVTPMRTMASDINRIHGYGAYRQGGGTPDEAVIKAAAQEDLLKDRPRLTNIPKVGE